MTESSNDSTQRTVGRPKHVLAANLILTITVIVALAFLVAFARDRRRLYDQVVQLRSSQSSFDIMSGTLSGPPDLQIGDIVPSFEALNLNDQKVELAPKTSIKRLLFFFSPECGACMSEMPNWNRIADLARSGGHSVFGVSLKSAEVTRRNLSGLELGFDVLIMPNIAVQRAYRVVAEPLIVVTSSKGTVEWVHYGVMNDQKMEELSTILR